MSSSSTRRILWDLKSIEEENSSLYKILPNEDNIYEWRGYILPPDDSLYFGMLLPLWINFTKDYPNKAPSVSFPQGLVFHPNFFENGNVCLDILQNKWSPMMNANTIILSLIILLKDPNVDSPANPKAAKMYSENYDNFY